MPRPKSILWVDDEFESLTSHVLFLAEQAGFMTGQNITIDGGMTVKMIYAE